MKIRFVLALLVLCTWDSFAREDSLKSTPRPDFIISLNLAGDVSIISVGFEKLFFIKPSLTLAGKAGLGFNQEFQIFSEADPDNFFILPHQVTANYGKRKSFLEFGIGGSIIIGGGLSEYIAYPIVGYRLHPFKNRGFSFRAWLFYPFGQLEKIEKTEMLVVPYGISFGIAF
jgi:hypothetical protein